MPPRNNIKVTIVFDAKGPGGRFRVLHYKIGYDMHHYRVVQQFVRSVENKKITNWIGAQQISWYVSLINAVEHASRKAANVDGY